VPRCAHIHDLVAVTLGASRGAEEVAAGRGIRAARLQAIKDDICANLLHELNFANIAARHRVSPRYLRMLLGTPSRS
jgi:AraC-like DNA-binding protein